MKEAYMRRALQIARNGIPYAMPNPLVGAVIVDADGQIIGEGYHRRCGEAHAEVNAIAAVDDPAKLRQSTMYVTLEPCAHYGRTGPCAKLIIEKGIPEVVVATRDPFAEVDGRGIEMLQQAGVRVSVGMLGEEARRLNAIFMTAHTEKRPFILLKWAQSADGYLDTARELSQGAKRISNAVTTVLTQRLRGICDGILVGSNTVLLDTPRLDNRLAAERSPRPIILDRRGRVSSYHCRRMVHGPIIIRESEPLDATMRRLYDMGITSILVEGGGQVHESFIAAGLWDVARVETSPLCFGEYGRVIAPRITDREAYETRQFTGNMVKYYSKNPLIDVKNL